MFCEYTHCGIPDVRTVPLLLLLLLLLLFPPACHCITLNYPLLKHRRFTYYCSESI
jgi:hypothetical protein